MNCRGGFTGAGNGSGSPHPFALRAHFPDSYASSLAIAQRSGRGKEHSLAAGIKFGWVVQKFAGKGQRFGIAPASTAIARNTHDSYTRESRVGDKAGEIELGTVRTKRPTNLVVNGRDNSLGEQSWLVDLSLNSVRRSLLIGGLKICRRSSPQ